MSANPMGFMMRQGRGMGANYNIRNLPPGFTTNAAGQVLRSDGSVFYDPYDETTREYVVGANSYTASILDRINASNQQLSQQQLAALLAAQQQSGFGGSVTAQGINIGGLQVSWPTLALIAFGIYLLQRPGYEKRSR